MAELNLRMAAHNAIKRIHDRILGANYDACDISQLQQELKAVTAHYDRFVNNHQVLVGTAVADEFTSHELLWEQVEALYNETCVKLNRKVLEIETETTKRQSNKTDESTSGLSAQKFDVKLDPVVIPAFDGSLHNWLAFKDTFQNLVHEMEFPEAYKLGKLRQAVSATKVPLIGAMYSGGYEEVWTALKKRYDNPKLLAETHVSRFLNIKPASDETARTLLSIVDTVQESLRALKVMELPVDKWDALAVPIVVSKLPISTQREWNMNCSSDEIPSLSSLLNFLEKRAHSLSTEVIRAPNRSETSNARQQNRAHHPVKTYVAATDEGKCHHCQGPHRVGRCQSLMAMRPEQRFDALKTSNLCFNCLKHGHSSRQCSSGGCRQCGRKHHTIFCRESRTSTPAVHTTEVPAQDMQTASSSSVETSSA